MSSTPSTQKKQGPIRWNAIIPFTIIVLLVYGYFYLFFDGHMKKALEWGAYKALGVEVNIQEFKSSFLHGHVQLTKIEITDSKKPEFNALELSTVKFDVNWDALLRLKFVIEEIAVDGIQFMSKRAKPGQVAPPPPPSNEPSLTSQLQEKALNKLAKENQKNLLGDISVFLKTGQFDTQLKSLESELASKKLLEEMNIKWTQKKNDWDKTIQSLPNQQELNQLKERFGKIKYKDFKTPQELEASIKEIDALLKELDSKNKQISKIKTDFESDIKTLDQDYKNIDVQIKKDIDTLKSRFKIPKLDAASFAKALFMDYLAPIIQKVDHYKGLAEKYLPPKYAKMVKGEKTPTQPDDSIQPHPREKGVTYEFPIEHGYPLFWIQKIKISSTSNAQADYGDFNGLISNITSNQKQIGRPTTIDIKGQFKKMNVSGIQFKAELNNIPAEAIVKFNLGVGAYPINNLKLIDSPDGSIEIPSTTVGTLMTGSIVGFKNYDIQFKNNFSNVSFQVGVKEPTVKEILEKTLSSIQRFDLEASAKGELKDLNFEIQSSLATDLQKSFENVLKTKIAEANEQLQKSINKEIGKLKDQVQAQTDAIKNQIQKEITKVQAQIDEQKKSGQAKIDASKKDFENQAKSKIQQEGQKALDDLKKKLGF